MLHAVYITLGLFLIAWSRNPERPLPPDRLGDRRESRAWPRSCRRMHSRAVQLELLSLDLIVTTVRPELLLLAKRSLIHPPSPFIRADCRRRRSSTRSVTRCQFAV
jgi:hypothetical protein